MRSALAMDEDRLIGEADHFGPLIGDEHQAELPDVCAVPAATALNAVHTSMSGTLLWSPNRFDAKLDDFLAAAHRQLKDARLRHTWEETALVTLHEQDGNTSAALDVLNLKEDLACSSLWSDSELDELRKATRKHGGDSCRVHASLRAKRSLAETVGAMHLHCGEDSQAIHRTIDEDSQAATLMGCLAKRLRTPRLSQVREFDLQTSDVRLSLADLINLGIVEAGQQVLSYQCGKASFIADLLPSGEICFTPPTGDEPQIWATPGAFVRGMRAECGLDTRATEGWKHVEYRGLRLQMITESALRDFQLDSPNFNSMDEQARHQPDRRWFGQRRNKRKLSTGSSFDHPRPRAADENAVSKHQPVVASSLVLQAEVHSISCTE